MGVMLPLPRKPAVHIACTSEVLKLLVKHQTLDLTETLGGFFSLSLSLSLFFLKVLLLENSVAFFG
jgi:hypothetical protein